MTASKKQFNDSSVVDAVEFITDMCKETERTDLKTSGKTVSEGKRKDRRQTLLTVVDYTMQGNAYRDFIHNISTGGVFIETSMSFSVGQELSLTFTLPSYRKHVKITGEIVRISPQGIGVRFKTAKQREEAELQNELGERRKYKRFRLQVSAFALVNRPFSQMGEIIDISRGGLSFRYAPDKEIPKGSLALDILCVDDGFRLGRVPAKTVAELNISKEVRRLGVQFGRLTNKQSSQLKSFIQTHAAGEL